MSNLAVLASVIILSSGSVGNVPEMGLSNGESVKPVVAVNTFGSAKVGDSTIQSAVDVIIEARKAVKVNERRNRMKPGIQDRVVEREKTKSDRVMIMGGKEAFPM
ncbi:MAG: hypothetical protein SGJ27_19960 [Candidatus Melainabacteria bacterium]|nr:hypothetical protein [Candidatus Melainabacteria bacterium]